MIKARMVVQLDNQSPRNWTTWKRMESHLSQDAEEEGMLMDDISYNNEEMTKSFIGKYHTDEDFLNAVFKLQACVLKHGLEISLRNKIICSSPELEAINEYFDKERT